MIGADNVLVAPAVPLLPKSTNEGVPDVPPPTISSIRNELTSSSAAPDAP